MANVFNVGDSVLCTLEKDGKVVAKRGFVVDADDNFVKINTSIELSKQYRLKPYDSVENHRSISRTIWDRLRRFPLVPISFNNGCCECKGDPEGYAWWILPDALCEYVPTYNGKVVCYDNAGQTHRYTVGKIYTFVDGYIVNDHDTQPKSRPIKDFADWVEFSDAKWIEIVD